MTAAWGLDDVPDQTGRTALVTGATGGLGLSAARGLAGAGARVVLAGRDTERLESARRQVAEVARGDAPEVATLDLGDLDSVRAAAADVLARHDRLDLLLANAGIMAVPRGRTRQGYERQLGVNHLGHFALAGVLLPALLAAPGARVVTTTSTTHRFGRMRWHDLHADGGYRPWAAYARSKLANMLFSVELARRASAAGTDLVSAAAHPGYAATDLPQLGARQRGRSATAMVIGLGDRFVAQPADEGALPLLYAATMPDVRGGELFGPSGPFEMRGHPVRVSPARRALDPDAAARLWALSERLSGVAYDWPEPDPASRRRPAAGSG